MVPSAFASLVDSFLKEEYEDSPTLASSLGLTEYDERLDDTSAAAYERRRASDLEWLRKFRAVGGDGLAPAESIDRDLLVSVLRGRELYQPLEMWKRQPNYYLNPGLNGVFSLFLHRLRPERELAAAAELRERGREQHALLSTEANRIATEIDGSGDWAKTCDRLNKIHAPTPDAMRDEYAEWTERARTFLRDTQLVTLPAGEKCTVEPSPPFQRPVLAVASYQRP